MSHPVRRDRDDFFAVQMKRPYCAEYEAKLPEVLRTPRTMAVFETLRADRSETVQ